MYMQGSLPMVYWNKKKKKPPQLSPAPTGTVHTEVSSCTLKNVLVRLTVTKSKV